VLLLCNKSGVVIDHRGEEAEATQFRYWGVWIGGVWAEDVEGTNGIGTCITEERPVTVHMSQHFRSRHIGLSCSGAPIFDAHGEFAGVLDVSSIDPTLSEHAHALTGALTVAAARAIEERLFRTQFRRDWIIAVRGSDDIGSAMLISVDRDQRIVGADRTGREALARWGHRADEGVGFWKVFEASDALFHHQNRGDLQTQVTPLGSDRAYAAILTPPEATSARRLQPENADLHVRPRREMLAITPWMSESLPVRGGLPPATLRRVRDYIDAHLHQSIDLESLARTAGLSAYHFARVFKHSEGLTPHAFVLERRLAKARDLLGQADLSLAEIASVVGFADQSHFTRRFREVVGTSPGRFRSAQKS
jgi:AraC-like DNA-binding protein